MMNTTSSPKNTTFLCSSGDALIQALKNVKLQGAECVTFGR